MKKIISSGTKTIQDKSKVDLIIERDLLFDQYLDAQKKLHNWQNHNANYTGREENYSDHRKAMIDIITEHIDDIKKRTRKLDEQINKKTLSDIYLQLSEIN
jgi:predicted  nucleic acid-binding Zn ribbon protein